jgi:hypothetical protein
LRLNAPGGPGQLDLPGHRLALRRAAAARGGVAPDEVCPGRAQGSVALSLCTTAHPLHTRFTEVFGASISETTMRANPSPDTTEKGYHAPAAHIQSGRTEPMCYGKRGGRAHARARTVVAVREGDDAVDVDVGLRADLGYSRIVVSDRAVPNTTVNPMQSGCAVVQSDDATEP